MSEPTTIENGNAWQTLPPAHGSLATASVRTLLAEMMAALDAGESEKYWQMFEAVMKRHEELLAEVNGPENDQALRSVPAADVERKETKGTTK